jgi:anaerobic nitric oxide reductase flavorubredoxin
MHFEIKDSVFWVGKIDWELRKFHGEEYSAQRGSSYNSYLIKDEKTVLIDTVWAPFADEFIEQLSETVDLNSIDYIVANHGEIDHSGALAKLLERIPGKPVYCTANAVKSLKGHYHQDWNFQVVKTGHRLPLGQRELIFVEAPMLHWPDSMFCYLTKSEILFSNDAFGQHYATESIYNDLADPSELWEECIKYYANILTPFNSFVKKKIEEVVSLNLPVSMICPSHGVIWRDDPMQIVRKYQQWASDYADNQFTLIYDTMWNSTRRIAEAIADGINAADPSIKLKVHNAARSDKTAIITDIFRSKGVMVGSPTINRGILSAVGGILEQIRGLSFKKKKAASFSSYGWSGEASAIINDLLAKSGFEPLAQGPRILWYPDDNALKQCFDYGKALVKAIN